MPNKTMIIIQTIKQLTTGMDVQRRDIRSYYLKTNILLPQKEVKQKNSKVANSDVQKGQKHLIQRTHKQKYKCKAINRKMLVPFL